MGNQPFEKVTNYLLTLDPVHIGTGGYRLGRVDNTIVREPGTRLPKIPGSSISGALRAYTAMAIQSSNSNHSVQPQEKDEKWTIDYPKYKNMKYQRPDYDFELDGKTVKLEGDKAFIKSDPSGKQPMIKKGKDKKDRYCSCAGKGVDDGEGHCGGKDCPVCVAFGFSQGKEEGSSFQGLAQFSDARILCFPVYSMIGPVWLTCESIWAEHSSLVSLKDKNRFISLGTSTHEKMNFGWIIMQKEENNVLKNGNILNHVPEYIQNNLFLVADKVFSQLVNDNLEVRTSVAIDPLTGAAEHGALFTYEAIPRATVLWFDVIYSNPRYFRVNGKNITKQDKNDADIAWIKSQVTQAHPYLEVLGIGGMNTRGMGRVQIL
ncbi:MAG: RAMP superfamily CRISPR-associated protein [Pseudomonadota bacterium]